MKNKKNGEIVFSKYNTRKADYHWEQVNKHRLLKFNAFVYARYEKCAQIVSNLILKKPSSGEPKTMKILDVGCGDGVLLSFIEKKLNSRSSELYGVDLSHKAISAAQNKIKNGHFYKSSVYKLPFQENTFDVIVSTDVIEHVSRPKKMLKEIKKVAKENGNIIIGTPIKYTEEPQDKNHYQEFYPKQLIELIKLFFKDCKLIKSHNLLYFCLYNRSLKIWGKTLPLFRVLINFSSIFLHLNPFLASRFYGNELFSYMYIVCTKNK